MDFKISIPSDSDGFILLQCPKCSEFFKLTASDIEKEDCLNIYCPFCGLVNESYITSDILELAQIKSHNKMLNQLHNELKKIERSSKNSLVKFSAGEKPKMEYEKNIESKIDELEIVKVNCCKKDIKIGFLTNMCGFYCPFCGVNNNGN